MLGIKNRILLNWKNEVPVSNWIHKRRENKKVKQLKNNAKFNNNFFSSYGINSIKKIPINGITLVITSGLKKSKFKIINYIHFFESR